MSTPFTSLAPCKQSLEHRAAMHHPAQCDREFMFDLRIAQLIVHAIAHIYLVYSPAIDPQHRFRQFVGEQERKQVTSPGGDTLPE
jgi:hypothetical protein